MSSADPPQRTPRRADIRRDASGVIITSIGCPCGIGPEVAVAAAARQRGRYRVLVGDPQTIARAAEGVGVPQQRLVAYDEQLPRRSKIYVYAAGPELRRGDRRSGRPSRAAGAAQLAYIEAAYALTKHHRSAALVTGPVSKAAIASSGAPGARRFLGHTEWLQQLDGARTSVMCFAASQLVTSLVTTHRPLARVPRALTPDAVSEATVQLASLLRAMGRQARLAVCSLNPHAGESELLGKEETQAIAPGVRSARRRLRKRARIEGPIGAETAYRRAVAGGYDGVVAMYHDQATIPMKLVAFGDAVNVTMGLSVVRTSVDHGTGYDIAWQGRADARGMLSAMRLAAQLLDAGQ